MITRNCLVQAKCDFEKGPKKNEVVEVSNVFNTQISNHLRITLISLREYPEQCYDESLFSLLQLPINLNHI